jgi:endogenous inhibitor of DNA gyrase (YacG/DUF329 family)
VAKRIPDEVYCERLRKLAEELGRVPSYTDMDEYGPHTPESYRARFGGWHEAIEAAGFEKPGVRLNAKILDESTLLDSLRELADDLGRTPYAHEYSDHTAHSHRTLQVRFGSWNDALREAGLEINREHGTGPRELSCSNCGDTVHRKKNVAESQDHFFCDASCMGAWQSEQYEEDGNPRWASLPVECETCGKTVHRAPWQLESRSSHFCSLNCRAEWQRELGSDAPWHPNDPKLDGYGPGWNEDKRESVRERDGRRCQSCGKTENENLAESGCKLHVHHITPARQIDEPKKRNAQSNLVALCNGCHQRWEGIPVRPTLND